MSQPKVKAKFRGDAIIIAVLMGLFFYVSSGKGPFNAEAYDRKGAPITVEHHGSSSDYRFAAF